MALFGKKTDVIFFRGINREILHKIISTYVDVYQLSMNQTEVDLYGEAPPSKKTYFQPVRMACKFSDDPNSADYTEKGYDVNQLVLFKFLKDDLMDANLVINAGDIINWNNGYYEVDHTIENWLYMHKDPDVELASEEFGWSEYINCPAHLTRTNKLNIKRTRSGSNK